METVMNALDWVINHWETIAAYVAGSTGIALFVQVIKKKFKLDQKLTVLKIDAQKFIMLLLGVISFVASAADVILTNGGSTLTTLFPQTAHVWPYLITGAVFVHRFVVSGRWKKFEAFLVKVSDYKSYQASKQNVQPTVIPPATFAED